MARGSIVVSGVSWVTGAVLAVLAVNVASIVAGVVVVPEGRRPALWAGLAAITVQCAADSRLWPARWRWTGDRVQP